MPLTSIMPLIYPLENLPPRFCLKHKTLWPANTMRSIITKSLHAHITLNAKKKKVILVLLHPHILTQIIHMHRKCPISNWHQINTAIETNNDYKFHTHPHVSNENIINKGEIFSENKIIQI